MAKLILNMDDYYKKIATKKYTQVNASYELHACLKLLSEKQSYFQRGLSYTMRLFGMNSTNIHDEFKKMGLTEREQRRLENVSRRLFGQPVDYFLNVNNLQQALTEVGKYMQEINSRPTRRAAFLSAQNEKYSGTVLHNFFARDTSFDVTEKILDYAELIPKKKVRR